MSRFVLLGGTFDPVHVGHVALARRAAEALAATALLVVEPGHPHRAAPVASLAHRQALVRRAVADEPAVREGAAAGVAGDLTEVVARLVAGGHEVHVVFGADSARHLQRWDGVRRLQPAQLWVAPRAGDDGTGITGVRPLDVVVPPVSATTIRFALAAGRVPAALVSARCLLEVRRLYAPAADASSATA